MMKKFIFLSLLVLLPFSAAVLVEALLFSFGAGYSTDPMKEAPGLTGVLIQNPYFLKKYYSPSSLVPPDEQGAFLVTAQKDKNTLRGIVLGESTPQGFPFYLNQSFPAVAAAAWNEVSASAKLEILNFGRSAMSSFYLKDAAQKMLPLKPDFLVVYGGHNEYFGTLSAFTGILPELNLALKEFRTGQLLLDALSAKPVTGKNLMATQFDAFKEVHFTPEQDELVVKVFLRNLESALIPYLKNGIPVFLFEPVANYLDMPPFRSGEGSGGVPKIREIIRLLNRNDPLKAAEVLKGAPLLKDTASGIFLQAQIERISSGNPDLKKFKTASDSDLVPFRAKGRLVEALRQWAEETAGNYSHLRYIPSEKLILSEFGPEGFSNYLFIDHLHFNWEGQRLMARYLLDAMAAQWPQLEIQGYRTLLEDPGRINRLVGMTPPLEYKALAMVEDLAAQEPFRSMAMGYPMIAPETAFEGAGEQDQELLRWLQGLEDGDFISRLIDFYRTAKPGTGMHRDLEAMAILFPANWQAQWMYGRLMLGAGAYDAASGPLSRAFLLSGRKPEIAADLRALSAGSGRPEILDLFHLR